MKHKKNCKYCGNPYEYAVYHDERGEVERHEHCVNCGFVVDVAYGSGLDNTAWYEDALKFRAQAESKAKKLAQSKKRRGYHVCSVMPTDEFAEIQQAGWHIHKTTMKHSEYRVEIEDGICPYCGRELN